MNKKLIFTLILGIMFLSLASAVVSLNSTSPKGSYDYFNKLENPFPINWSVSSNETLDSCWYNYNFTNYTLPDCNIENYGSNNYTYLDSSASQYDGTTYILMRTFEMNDTYMFNTSAEVRSPVSGYSKMAKLEITYTNTTVIYLEQENSLDSWVEFTLVADPNAQVDVVKLWLKEISAAANAQIRNFKVNYYEDLAAPTINLTTDLNNLTFYANDSSGDLVSNLTTWDYKIIENSRTLNTTSYETKSETFSVNVTANSSLTAVQLEYNGTLYSTTQSGTVYSKTLDIPIGVSNNTVRWKFTYAGDSIYSDYSYQNIELLNFSLCDGSLTNDFLNISFKDEDDLSTINASIPYSLFTYYLGSGAVNKSYTYSISTNAYTFRFCATPTTETLYVKPYVQYKQGTDYPQRIWDAAVQTLTSTVTDKILYLLNTIDGIYVTFQVINVAQQPILGVIVNATREISGQDVVVANGQTDSAGAVTFWLNPDFTHTIQFIKSGYSDLTFTTAPTQSIYTVTMSSETSSSEPSCIRGISYVISTPDGDLAYLDENTMYNFSFYLESDYWNVDNFTASLYWANGTIIDSAIETTQGGTISFLNVNTTNQDIYFNYSFSTNGTVCVSDQRVWYTQETYGRQFSLFRLFSDIGSAFDNNLYGINGTSNDGFGRILIVFVILVGLAGTMISRYGIQNEVAIMSLVFGATLFLDQGVHLIPTLSVGQITVPSYFISALTFILFLYFLIKEEIR